MKAWTKFLHNAQHRTTFYLLLNNAMAAGTGLLFWFIMVRLAGLPPDQIGIGYAIIALGTTISLVSKGGLDTALLRNVPKTNTKEGLRLLGTGIFVAASAAVALSAALALASRYGGPVPQLEWGWLLVAVIAMLMIGTSLQDAWFLAQGDAKATFRRNMVFSSARIALPLPILALAPPEPVPVIWLLALIAAALAGIILARRRPQREGTAVPRTEFLRCAARNITSSAAEFLPGLLLVPLVLATQGAASAAYFGMAWTAAAVLLLGSAAIGRSALTSMVRDEPAGPAVRRATRQALLVLGPVAILGIVLSRFIMGIFGKDYATESATAFAILCASTLFVAPAFLYLAYLRAQDRPTALVVFPLALITVLFLLAPLLATKYGLAGVAMAWLGANVPFGLYAATQLLRVSKEVNAHEAPDLRGGAHAE